MFDLTLLFLKSYLGMYGWNINGKKSNIIVSFFQPEFKEHKENMVAINAYKYKSR